jgi:hypothetical protein
MVLIENKYLRIYVSRFFVICVNIWRNVTCWALTTIKLSPFMNKEDIGVYETSFTAEKSQQSSTHSALQRPLRIPTPPVAMDCTFF